MAILTEDLISVADDLSEVMGLEPKIKTDGVDSEAIIIDLQEAAKELFEDDKVKQESKDVLFSLGIETPWEAPLEEEAKKKGKKGTKREKASKKEAHKLKAHKSKEPEPTEVVVAIKPSSKKDAPNSKTKKKGMPTTTINKQELVEALTAAKQATSNDHEQSSCFIFSNTELWAGNAEITIVCVLNSGIEGAVDAVNFLSVIDRMNGEEISITDKGTKLIVKCGKTKAQIRINKKIVLERPSVPVEGWVDVPYDFAESALFCIYNSASQLNGCPYVLLIKNSDLFYTTGGRLVKKTMASSMDCDILVPLETIKKLNKHRMDKCSTEDGSIHFKNAAMTISCRTSIEKYPRETLESTLKVEGKEIPFNPDLYDALDRVSSIFKGSEKMDMVVKMSIEKNKMTLSGKGIYGDITEVVEVQCEDKKDIVVESRFLPRSNTNIETMIIGEHLLLTGDNFKSVSCGIKE